MVAVSFGIVALLGSEQVLVADAAGRVARELRMHLVLGGRAGRRQRIPSLLCFARCYAGRCGLVAQLVRAHA